MNFNWKSSVFININRLFIILFFLSLLVLNSCSIFFPEPYGYVSADTKRIRKNSNRVFIPKNAPSVLNGFKPMENKESLFQVDSGHNGIDIIEKKGTPVISPAKGRVIRSSYGITYGHTLVISHGKGPDGLFIKTRYYHLNKRLVQKGDMVIRGQQIGELGRTGFLSGGILHLHFEVWGSKTQDLRYAKPFNPHRFWYDGLGIVTCFDTQRQYDDISFKTTYPVKCI